MNENSNQEFLILLIAPLACLLLFLCLLVNVWRQERKKGNEVRHKEGSIK